MVEEKINEGLLFQVPIQDGDEENEENPVKLRSIIPLYSRVSLKHERQPERDGGYGRRQQNQRRQQQQQQQQGRTEPRWQERYEAPAGLRANISNGSITLTTFGSIRKAFQDSFVNTARLRTSRPQYDLVVVCLLYTSPSPRDA